MVELHEFPIDFHALFLVQHHGIVAGGDGSQVVQKSRLAMGLGTIGPAIGFQLQQSHIDTHLQHRAIRKLQFAHIEPERIELPAAQDFIDIFISGHGFSQLPRSAKPDLLPQQRIISGRLAHRRIAPLVLQL